MDGSFMQKLVRLREGLGFPLPVNSGYRCPEYNQEVSSTGPDGPHTTGRAVDIGVSGKEADLLIDAMKKFGFTGRGINQKGDHLHRFVHIDDLTAIDGFPRPITWTY